jgi:hypothetical protein
MGPEKKPDKKTGFEALLHQNEIAEAQEQAANPQASIEERIRANAPAPKNSVVRNIRTLQDDIAENIDKGKTTIVSVASALHTMQNQSGVNVIVSRDRGQRWKRIGVITLALVLILSGIGGLGYVFFIRQNNTVTINESSPIVFAEKTDAIDTTGVKFDDIRNKFTDERDNADEQLGTILGVVFTKQASTTDGKQVAVDITIDDLFRDLKLQAPSRLIRSLGNQYQTGIHIFDGNQPFFIFKTTLYESAFSGMLDWEKTMTDDLGPLLRSPADFYITVAKPQVVIPPATSTSKTKSSKNTATTTTTTTPVAAPAPIPQLAFEDMVYKNIDTRVLKNQDGKVLIVYSFVSRDTLVITTKLETLGEIMNRLTSRQVVQ